MNDLFSASFYMNLNEKIFFFLNGFAGKWKWLDSFIVFFGNDLAYWLILIFVVLFFVNFFKGEQALKMTRWFFYIALPSYLLATGVVKIIRFYYYNHRPFVENKIVQLIQHDNVTSFPSGHATFFFTLAMVIYFYNKRWSAPFFIGAILMSLGRIAGGIHWPLDVLAGISLAFCSVVFVSKITEKVFSKKS